jgi:uncharacterized protein YdhG (YjbR/CyaY superfamily)
MANGVQTLEEKIERFETLLEEMKEATREAHSSLKALNKERKEIERLLSDKKIKEMLDARIDEVVGTELRKIGPEIKERTTLIYDRVGAEIDKLIDLSLGKDHATQSGREDVRPGLATSLHEWLREELKKGIEGVD